MVRQKKGVRHAIEWYENNRSTYVDLVSATRELFKSLLVANSIAFVDVQGRAKTAKSFAEKVGRKSYANPEAEVTDLAGLRVIVLIESDIARVREIVEQTFRVHGDFTVDKSDALGADRVGYRSLHLICDLGDVRLDLPEFKRFLNFKFEVQIRTALQHAWAEIEHDRGYKLSGELPSHLKRKFSLLAGLLELADTQFDELSQAIDRYAQEISVKAGSGDLSIELNSSSIKSLLSVRFGDGIKDPVDPETWKVLVQELHDFGVKDLEYLNLLMTDEVRDLAVKSTTNLSIAGLVRDIMIFNDIDKYFERAWKGGWNAIDSTSYSVIVGRYGEGRVDVILGSRDISVHDDSESYPDEAFD